MTYSSPLYDILFDDVSGTGVTDRLPINNIIRQDKRAQKLTLRASGDSPVGRSFPHEHSFLPSRPRESKPFHREMPEFGGISCTPESVRKVCVKQIVLRVCMPGRRPISGERNGRKIDFGLTGKIGEKNRPKTGQMARKRIFDPFFLFLGDFFPLFSWWGQNRFFGDFFFRFRASGLLRHTHSQKIVLLFGPGERKI